LQGDEFGLVEVVIELRQVQIICAFMVNVALPFPDPQSGDPRYQGIDVIVKLVEVVYPIEFGDALLSYLQDRALEGSPIGVIVDELFKFLCDRLLRLVHCAIGG
jgi:hypothetical protein